MTQQPTRRTINDPEPTPAEREREEAERAELLDLALSILGAREMDVRALEIRAESITKQAQRARELFEQRKRAGS